MKKTLLTVLAMMLVSLCGCDEIKPIEWDVSKDKTWEVWASGELVRMGTMRNPDCTNGEHCNNHPPIQSYIFNDEREISVINIKNPGNVKLGQVGKLYKYNNDTSDHNAWFQWIVDETVVASPAKKEIKSELIEYNEVAETPELICRWKSYSTSKPVKYQIVLSKLSNGIITTGHLNHINEFKLEANRDVEDNGRTITNVVSWKEIDLN